MTAIAQTRRRISEVFDIEDDIGTFSHKNRNTHDFIHMSQVIEHVPKHSLLFIGDAIYKSLSLGGELLVRCPNMEGPFALSSMYVTLGHGYGFAGSNVHSLLDICDFDDITFSDSAPHSPSPK